MRNRYAAEFLAQAVFELLSEEATLNQVATSYQLNPRMISHWKSDFIKKATAIFERSKDNACKLKQEMDEKETRYQQIIEQQFYGVDWLKNLASSSTPEARKGRR